jgi:hypothetical protein
LKTLPLVLLLLAQLAAAKDTYTMTITVVSTKNVTSEYETERAAANSDNSRSWRGHTVNRHVVAVGSDGNVYDLTPQDPKDFLIPGKYPAYVTSRGMVVGGPESCTSFFGNELPCSKPTSNKHRKIKFNIVSVESKQPAE